MNNPWYMSLLGTSQAEPNLFDRSADISRKKGEFMKTTTNIKLTQEGAMMLLHGALDKAQSLHRAASVTVVDDGGHMLAFGRSDDELYSIPISLAKARSATFHPFPVGKKESQW
jgi:hypothetical protein